MAAIKYIKRTVALDGNSISEQLPASFFNSEQTAHTFIIAATRGGQPLTLSGAVSATFLNANDAEVPVTGSIVDGAAVVTLSNECYDLSGRFTLTIDVNGATVYECQSRIKRRSSGTAYDPSGEISVATLSAEIAEMRAATADAIAAAAAASTLTDVVYSHDALLQNAYEAPLNTSVSGWRLNESNGLCSSNSSYQLKKYAVTPGDEIKVTSDDRFQYQSSASVPSTGTSNRVGSTTYQTGEYHLIVPAGASWLIVSTPVSGSTAQVDFYSDRISELARNTNSNLILLPDASTTGSGLTTFKKVGHEITAVGTATATKLMSVYYNTSGFPDGMEPGGEYYISFHTQSIKLQILGYLQGSSDAVYFLSGCYSSCKLKVPENAVGINIRFNVPNGTTVNETAIFSISKWPGNDLLLGYGESAYLFDPTRNRLHDIYTNFKPGYYNASNVYSELTNAIISEILGPFTEPITINITNSGAKYYIYFYNADETMASLSVSALEEQITIPRNNKFRIGIRITSGVVRDIFKLATCVWASTKTYDSDWVLDPFRKADGATHLIVTSSDVNITASTLQMSASRLAWWFTAEKTVTVRSSLLDFKVRVYNASTNQISQSAAYGDAWLKTATLGPGNYYIYAALASDHNQSISIANYGSDLTSRDLEVMVEETQATANSNGLNIERIHTMDYPAFAEIGPFEKKALTYSDSPITYGSNTTVRRSLITDFAAPVVLNMYHPDYVFRVAYYDGGGEQHLTGWTVIAHIPAGNNIGITVKCRTDRAFGDDEMPHLWMYPVDYCDKPKSYFESEIADTIAKVRKYRTEPGLCLFVSTDQHNMSVQGTLVKQDTVTDMANNMRAVIQSVRPDAHVALGDLTDYKWNDNTVIRETYGLIADTADQADSIFFDWMTYSYERLLNVFDTFLYVPGNHDDNRYINRDRLQETVSRYDYTPGEVYAYYLANSNSGRVSNPNNNCMDYYVDWPSTKIRVICLDANYYNPAASPASGYTYKDAWWYGFSNETAPWLSSVLSATPSDYSVLILTHMSPVTANNADNAEYMNFSSVKSAIQNYVNGGGKLIGEIYGHSHVDWMTTNPWVDVTLNCQKCQNASTTYPNMPGAVHPTRTVVTATEDCWNIVLVKPISGRLDIIRFGAGNDRFIHYRDITLSGNTTVTSQFSSVASWASNNTSVATVSNGVISRVSAGRAMITATNSSGDTEHWSVVVS